jgi:hypothetical protein
MFVGSPFVVLRALILHRKYFDAHDISSFREG